MINLYAYSKYFINDSIFYFELFKLTRCKDKNNELYWCPLGTHYRTLPIWAADAIHLPDLKDRGIQEEDPDLCPRCKFKEGDLL